MTGSGQSGKGALSNDPRHDSPEHEELVALTPDCLTRWHSHHYRGFAKNQWDLFGKTGELKPLLYTLRVLLTAPRRTPPG
jgi:predicted nucleotidyltransferase